MLILGHRDRLLIGDDLGLGLVDLRLLLVDDQAEGHRIDGEERVALLDRLIVMDIERDDGSRHLRRDRDQIRAHIGIVGIGDEIGCDLIGEECRDDEADHQQNPSTPTHGSPLLSVGGSPRSVNADSSA